MSDNINSVVEPSACECEEKSSSEDSSQLEITRLKKQLEQLQASTAVEPQVVTPSSVGADQGASRVFALGTLGYDFGSEARRDSFKQLMVADQHEGINIPGNPYDARQMVNHLEGNLSEARSIIWTLNLELTPIYAIEADGPFARDVYEILLSLLSDQIRSEDDKDFVERICIPGVITGATTTLFSGQEVPVIKLTNGRGIYGWKVNNLVDQAVASMCDGEKGNEKKIKEQGLRDQLQNFLERVYYSLRNLGTTSHDRALNYAATNAFQATTAFSDSLGKGMELDDISVEKSPFGRMDSDCWDVHLKFFNPSDSRHSKRIYRFTIDVSETIPVTIGKVRSWSSSI